MIELKSLTKRYGESLIFDNVNAAFDNPAYIYGVFGPSGSGKSTLFHILFGLDQDYEGDYIFCDSDAKQMNPSEWSRIRTDFMQIVFQDFKLLENMTVYENLYFALSSHAESDDAKITDVLNDLHLSHLADQPVKTLSGGEKQRLAICRAVLNNPRIILLDEPTGNLDDQNTEDVMKLIAYMRDMGIMVIIISHDSRVMQICDVYYAIQNRKLVHMKGEDTSAAITSKHEYSDGDHRIWEYVTAYLKHCIKDLSLNNVPIIGIFMVFMVCFCVAWSYLIGQLDLFYGGLDRSGIYLNTENYTSSYLKENRERGKTVMDDGTRIYFSQEDLAAVRKLNGVEDADIMDIGRYNCDDTEAYTLEYQFLKEDLADSLKKSMSYPGFPDMVPFQFETLRVKKSFSDIYNPLHIELIAGRIPDDDSDQLLIPDYLAITWFGSAEEALDQLISLPVRNTEQKKADKKYCIAGVYKSSFDTHVEENGVLYLGYRHFDASLTALITGQEGYEMSLASYKEYNGDPAGTVFESYETYLKAVGTGQRDILIRLKDSSMSAEVSESLHDLFPNLNFISSYELSRGSFRNAYRAMWTLILLGAALLAGVFGIIIIMLNRNYIRKRNKELAILYNLGYTRKELIKILLREYFTVNTVDYLITYLLLYGLYSLLLKHTSFYLQLSALFKPELIFIGYLFVMVMTLLSICYSVFGIKRSNLVMYLK